MQPHTRRILVGLFQAALIIGVIMGFAAFMQVLNTGYARSFGSD
jgi:hypothetical protein